MQNELACHTSAVADGRLLVHSEREVRINSQCAPALLSPLSPLSKVNTDLLDLLSKKQMTKVTVTRKIMTVKEMTRAVREKLWNKNNCQYSRETVHEV